MWIGHHMLVIPASMMDQLRVLDLPGAVQPGEQALPLQQNEVAFPDQERSDESMVKEANTNRILSESFVASRGLIGMWNIVELLLRAEVRQQRWKNSDQVRSHLGMPLLAEHFYSMLSNIQQSFWSGAKLFQMDPTGDTSIDAAEAQAALINAEIKTCGFKQGSLKQEMRCVLYDGFLYGLGCGIQGWASMAYKVRKKTRKPPAMTIATNAGSTYEVPTEDEDEQALQTEPTTIEINSPHFEHIPIRRLRADPSCRRSDIRYGKWMGRLIYMNAYELDKLRDTEGFNIPSREQLIKLTTPQKMDSTTTNPLDTQGSSTTNPLWQQSTTPQKAYPENYDGSTVDPLMKDFEIFDYWTDERNAMILEGEYCIYNGPNDQHKIPGLSFAYRDAPDSLYGYGLGFWLGDFQRIIQGIINAFMDDLNLNLMGTYTAPAGMANSAQNQWIFPGKIWKSDTQAGKLEALARNSVQGQEVLGVIAQVKEWASQIGGAGIGILGSNPGAPGDVRTKQGAQAMAGGEATKAQDLMDVISDQILIPFLEFCVENNRKLKPSQIRAMLTQEMGAAFKETPISIINGTYKLNITAGTKLAARQALNQSLGFIESMLQAPGMVEMLAGQGMKIDFNSLVKALFDSTGYPYREQIVIPMTDEEKQQYQAAQGKPDKTMEKIAAQTQGKMQVDNNQAENRVLLNTGESVLKSQSSTQDHNEARTENVEQAALQRAERIALQKSDSSFMQE